MVDALSTYMVVQKHAECEGFDHQVVKQWFKNRCCGVYDMEVPFYDMEVPFYDMEVPYLGGIVCMYIKMAVKCGIFRTKVILQTGGFWNTKVNQHFWKRLKNIPSFFFFALSITIMHAYKCMQNISTP